MPDLFVILKRLCSFHLFSIGKGRRMVSANEDIDQNRQDIEHRHDDKHFPIAKGGDQHPRIAAAMPATASEPPRYSM